MLVSWRIYHRIEKKKKIQKISTGKTLVSEISDAL